MCDNTSICSVVPFAFFGGGIIKGEDVHWSRKKPGKKNRVLAAPKASLHVCSSLSVLVGIVFLLSWCLHTQIKHPSAFELATDLGEHSDVCRAAGGSSLPPCFAFGCVPHLRQGKGTRTTIITATLHKPHTNPPAPTILTKVTASLVHPSAHHVGSNRVAECCRAAPASAPLLPPVLGVPARTLSRRPHLHDGAQRPNAHGVGVAFTSDPLRQHFGRAPPPLA